MKRANQILRYTLIMMLTALTFTSCVKKEYDDIETLNVDPNLTTTHTIKQLQALATGSTPVQITTDVIVAGIVVGDDASGNIYKKIILQQDSSGIAIQVDVTNFNTEYPIGRHVYVKCKGLYIANNSGNYEIGVNGGSSAGRIPANLLPQYLVKGKWGQTVTPMVFPVASTLTAGTVPTNTLVKFEEVEFESGANGVSWANGSSSNYNIEDCAAIPNTLVVYTSSYCTFALDKTPTGKGTIQGIYTVYNGAGELQIRDTYDVDMDGVRCDGSTGVPTQMPVDSVRLLDPGAGVTYLPGDKFIRVVVTTDYSTSMITAKNMYCQDATGAIQVRFTASNTFAVGTELDINVSGMELSTFAGVLQINNVPLGNATVHSPATLNITPRTATIADINANYAAWEGQLVKITGATITGTGTYSGSQTLTDATGTITLFTTSSATFAGSSYPTGTVSVTGVLTEYNGTKEILIRNPTNDVQ